MHGWDLHEERKHGVGIDWGRRSGETPGEKDIWRNLTIAHADLSHGSQQTQ